MDCKFRYNERKIRNITTITGFFKLHLNEIPEMEAYALTFFLIIAFPRSLRELYINVYLYLSMILGVRITRMN